MTIKQPSLARPWWLAVALGVFLAGPGSAAPVDVVFEVRVRYEEGQPLVGGLVRVSEMKRSLFKPERVLQVKTDGGDENGVYRARLNKVRGFVLVIVESGSCTGSSTGKRNSSAYEYFAREDLNRSPNVRLELVVHDVQCPS